MPKIQNAEKERVEVKKEQLLALTKEFCRKHLNEDYEQLCEKMILKMARKRNVPFISGRIESWAAAIVYALGGYNFIFDRSSELYMKGEDIAGSFGVSASTASAKASQIRDMFKMTNPFFDRDGEFTTEAMKEYLEEHNPLNRMGFTRDGFIVLLDK